MNQLNEDVSRLVHVEPLEHESISHFLGRLRRLKANSLPSASSLGQVAGIGAVTARWEKLYFNPFPTEDELGAIAQLIRLAPERMSEMLPHKGITFQPHPIRLCGACYAEVSCHRMGWQYKAIVPICNEHHLRLLERCPGCKTPFRIPALWTDGKCHHCGMKFTSMVKYQERIKKTD